MYQQHSLALPTCDGSISHVDFLGNNLLELMKIQVSHMICNNVCHCDTNRIVVLHIALENVNTVSYEKDKQIMFCPHLQRLVWSAGSWMKSVGSGTHLAEGWTNLFWSAGSWMKLAGSGTHLAESWANLFWSAGAWTNLERRRLKRSSVDNEEGLTSRSIYTDSRGWNITGHSSGRGCGKEMQQLRKQQVY